MTKTFRILTHNEGARCNLGAQLDLRVAHSLKAAILRALAKGKPLSLDASSVERMSTVCVQVLLAGEAAFGAKDLSFKFKNPSDAFNNAFIDLGLVSFLKQSTCGE